MDAAVGDGMGGQHLPAAAAAWAAVAEASGKVAAVAGQVWELSDADLVAVLRSEAVAAAQLDAARLAVVRELDTRGVAARSGAVSTAAWLSRELLVDGRVAAADVRAARQLDPEGDTPPRRGVHAPGLPPGHLALAATGRALLAGEVSRPHADVVAAMVRALPAAPGTSTPTSRAELGDLHARAQAWLLGQCATFTPTDVRRLGIALRHVVDPNGVLADERDATDRAVFWVRAEENGIVYRFGGRTDPVTAAALSTFIDAHAAPHPRVDEVTGERVDDPRTPEVRRGHAFTDLVTSPPTPTPASAAAPACSWSSPPAWTPCAPDPDSSASGAPPPRPATRCPRPPPAASPATPRSSRWSWARPANPWTSDAPPGRSPPVSAAP